MSNFVMVTLQDWGGENIPIRVNAERIEIMVPETAGTKIHTEKHVLRVVEDVSTILFRITQGEKP